MYLAMITPASKEQTGALIFKIVIFEKAMIYAKAVLNFIDWFEKPCCRLLPNTPRRENPTIMEMNSFGKI
jgi:hypothetical protein